MKFFDLPVALLCLALAVPAMAQSPAETKSPKDDPAEAAPATPPHSPTLSDLSQSMRNYFTEDETKMLYQYLRDSVVASFKGEDVYLDPELAFKLQVLLGRMKKEGGVYMDSVSKQLEQDLKKRMTPPPPAEYIPSRPFDPTFGGYLQPSK